MIFKNIIIVVLKKFICDVLLYSILFVELEILNFDNCKM